MASSEEDSRFQPVDLATDLRTYRPKYPLPPDLRDIPTEETFCAYCGVSYLILNEIKFLEEKSEKLKRELELVKQDTKVSLSVPCNGKHCSASFDEHQILEDIKHLKDEKVELIRRLDDANVKLICYEATEKQFVKEIAQSQAEVSFTQERLIELLDYLKQLRNRIKDSFVHKASSINSAFHSLFKGINDLRNHIGVLNQIYNNAVVQLTDQCDHLHNKLDSITLSKDTEVQQYVEKFNDFELKYKEERNSWSENRGQMLAEIIVLKTKLTEETKRIENLHDEKRKSTLYFEQTIDQLKEEIQSLSQENKDLKGHISGLNERISEQLLKHDSIKKKYKDHEDCLQKEIENMSEELGSIKKLNNQLNAALEIGKQEIFELKTIRDSQSDSCKQLQMKIQEMEKEFNIQMNKKESTLEKELKMLLETKESEIHEYKSQSNQKIEQLMSQVQQKEKENIVLQEEHRRIMQTMKDEISQLISVMNNSNLVKAKLEDQIEEYQLEIKQLHATIEKECWERDELNSALAETRDQLMNYLGSPSKNHLSDQKQSDQHEKQKDPSVLLPPITSPSKKSEDSLVRCRIASKSSSTSYSNSSGGGNTRRPLQNLRNVKDTSGLAATRRQIAAIISATKFR